MNCRDIIKLDNEHHPIPPGATKEEKLTYYALLGLSTAYGRCDITKNQCISAGAEIRDFFAELITHRHGVTEEYKRQQQRIKAAESGLTELMAATVPGADCRSLYVDALGIIEALEGMDGQALRRNAENRLDGIMPLSERAKAKPIETVTPKTKKKTAGFQKPTVEEIKDYCTEAKLNNVDAYAFFDYFESVGWKIGGKSPMKDWKAAVRNWDRRQFKPKDTETATATTNKASYSLEEYQASAFKPLKYKKQGA